MARPRTGETPIRHVRMNDTRWDALREIAEDEHVSVASLLNEGADRVIDNREQRRLRDRGKDS